jgi:hypothetical protein
LRTGPRGLAVVAVLAATLSIAAPGLGSATAAKPGASTTGAQLGSSLKAIGAAVRHHHVPGAKDLGAAGAAAHRLLAGTPDPTKACRGAVAAAQRLAGERRNPAKLSRDLTAARPASTACVAKGSSSGSKGASPSKPTPAPTPPPASAPTPTPPAAPQFVGGTVVDANGQPAAGVKVAIDVEFVVGYSGEEDTATTDAAGHFEFPDLPASEIRPYWKFLEPLASFGWNGAEVNLDLDTISNSDPTHLQYRLDGGTETDHDVIHLEIPNRLCAGEFTEDFPLTMTFAPASALADGTNLGPTTLSFSQAELCGGEALTMGVGFWTISGLRYHDGEEGVVSTDGGKTFAPSVEVFDQLREESSVAEWSHSETVVVD